ncbi:GvpL/GvpF family gas vesicle protein [soil metagenome]
MIYGYCVRRADDPAPGDDLTGITGASVYLLEERGLGLWYSELDRSPVAEVQQLREHDAVVRAALRSATPLPLRFGATFKDEDVARAKLRERSEIFFSSLEAVADRLEMGIRVSPVAADRSTEILAREDQAVAPADTIRTGREYLEARRRQLDSTAAARLWAEEAAARVEAHLSDLELPTKREIIVDQGVLALVAHLVQRSEVRTYRSRVEAMRESVPELHLVLTGPWAPYSFV